MKKIEASPCLDCGTTGGKSRVASGMPGRTNGLCLLCYDRGVKRKIYASKPNREIKPCVRCKTPKGLCFVRKNVTKPLPWRSKTGLCLACNNADTAKIRAIARKVDPCKYCGTTGGRSPGKHGKPARIGGLCRTCYERMRSQAEREKRQRERDREDVQIRIKLAHCHRKAAYFKTKMRENLTPSQQAILEYKAVLKRWGKSEWFATPKKERKKA